MAITSSRFYAIGDPARLEYHLQSVPQAELAEDKYPTRYIRSEADLDIAIRMMRCALDDRQPGGSKRAGKVERHVVAEPDVETATDYVPSLGTAMSDAEPSPRESTPVPRAPAQSPIEPRPPIRIAPEAAELASRIVKSEIYQSRLQTLNRAAPEDDRVRDTLALLLTRGGVAGFGAIADSAQLSRPRVRGVLALLARLMVVDGVQVLLVDSDAQEARLERSVLIDQFLDGEPEF